MTTNPCDLLGRHWKEVIRTLIQLKCQQIMTKIHIWVDIISSKKFGHPQQRIPIEHSLATTPSNNANYTNFSDMDFAIEEDVTSLS